MADASARSIEPGELERSAVAAYLAGRYADADQAWTQAHHAWAHAGDPAGSARCGFWLGFLMLLRGEEARSAGWLARAQRLLDESRLDCVERGYLLMPAGLRQMAAGEVGDAHTTYLEVVGIGERFDDRDLIAFGRLCVGEALIAGGQTAAGLALLDEAMVAVTTDDVSPIVAGIVYCAVIEACRDSFDLRRARQWTSALTELCDTQPEVVPFRGPCLVHRSEVMQSIGAWPDALQEAQRACALLSGEPAVGAAHYQQAELYRLRGELAAAEQAYRAASRWGRSPHPGLAQLRVAQGNAAAAERAIRRVIGETRDRPGRCRLLPAYVAIMLTVDDVPSARAAVDELSAIASDCGLPAVGAMALHAEGDVLLAEDDPRRALDALQRARAMWAELDVPYEAARARVSIARACRALDDDDSAGLELDAARAEFQRLGAGPDVAHVEACSSAVVTRGAPCGLTAREVEVLGLVATGRTNRAIAGDLVLSEKTVARHLSNIFTKLSVSSRAAATAFAYEHDLVAHHPV